LLHTKRKIRCNCRTVVHLFIFFFLKKARFLVLGKTWVSEHSNWVHLNDLCSLPLTNKLKGTRNIHQCLYILATDDMYTPCFLLLRDWQHLRSINKDNYLFRCHQWQSNHSPLFMSLLFSVEDNIFCCIAQFLSQYRRKDRVCLENDF
jgi:hypothetical protein